MLKFFKKLLAPLQKSELSKVTKTNRFLSSELLNYINENKSLKFEIKKLRRANEKLATSYMESIDRINELETKVH